MSFARRRISACVLCLLVVASHPWARRADAQTVSPPASRRVVVLVILPSAARLDASRLRTDVGSELGADVVAPDDPLAPVATGTLTLGLDASGDASKATLRYDARVDPVLREMALPPSPEAAERAIVLLAGNLARDESAELALVVRDRHAPKIPASEAVPLREPEAPARSTIHFGLGGEGLLWYVPGSSIPTNLGGRLFGRLNVDVSSFVTFRADLGLGALGSIGSGDGLLEKTTSFPISVRADLQLNVARHYAVGLGVDLGVDVYRYEDRLFTPLDPSHPTSGSASDAQGMLGLHASPLLLRFGHANQFQVSAQEGVLLLLEERNAVFEQTVSFTYLFGPAP